MLFRWFSKLEPVHRAATEAERRAVQRFYYKTFVEELGRSFPGADPARRQLVLPGDDEPGTVLLYTGTPDDMTSAVRVRIWPPGKVPAEPTSRYAMHRFAGIEQLGTAEANPVAIRPSLRGKMVLPALLVAGYELLAGETATDLLFFQCVPGLVRHYRRFGALPYGADVISGSSSVNIALVAVLSDHAMYRRTGSVVAPLVKDYFGPGKRRPLDPTRFAALFNEDLSPVETDPERVWAEVEEHVGRGEERSALLDALPEKVLRRLAATGFVLQVSPGAMLTRQGTVEREMFVILDGAVEVRVTDKPVAVLGRGDVFGEVAFFSTSSKRVATVRALTSCRVLVLRRKLLEELTVSDPAIGFQLMMSLAQVLADRFSELRSPEEPGDASPPS